MDGECPRRSPGGDAHDDDSHVGPARRCAASPGFQARHSLPPPHSRRDPASWPSVDSRRLLRVALHVRQLQDATRFYNEILGLLLVAPLDVPGAPIQRALLSSDLSPSAFGLELLAGGPALEALAGSWSGHFMLTVPDRGACLAKLRGLGLERCILSEEAAVIPVRNPAPAGSQTLQDIVAAVADLDGYTWRLVEGAERAAGGAGAGQDDRMVALAAHVPDLGVALAWVSSVLGMPTLHQYQSSSGYATALVGFPHAQHAGSTGPALELIQGDTAAQAESGLAHLVISTSDLQKTVQHLQLLRQSVEAVQLGAMDDPTGLVSAARINGPGNLRFCFVQADAA
uniref:VOC domain-containing protein n=1 Tax=Auxenochlorella protothecoides TaxID=3075 RepID=A0A1D2A5P1_AUXPR